MPIMSLGCGDEAFEFFKPVEDNVSATSMKLAKLAAAVVVAVVGTIYWLPPRSVSPEPSGGTGEGIG
ncbi:hypothetical protein MYX75_09045 [Acidobacteria bacterium AH-259-A15]|nr:hypothetical protein [Acidobacteria bacterium AH-259-A15]